MASTNTLCRKLPGVKHTVIKSQDFYTDRDGVNHLVSAPGSISGMRMTVRSATGDVHATIKKQHSQGYGEG